MAMTTATYAETLEGWSPKEEVRRTSDISTKFYVDPTEGRAENKNKSLLEQRTVYNCFPFHSDSRLYTSHGDNSIQ
jgi:hypothetical protein